MHTQERVSSACFYCYKEVRFFLQAYFLSGFHTARLTAWKVPVTQLSTKRRARAKSVKVSIPPPTVPSPPQTDALQRRPPPHLQMSCPHANRGAALDAQSDVPGE